MKPAVNVVVPVYRSEENLEEMCEGGSGEHDCSITRPFIPSTLTGVADRKQTTCSTRSGPTDACQPGVVAHELAAALLGRDLNKPEVHDRGAEAVAALKAESAL